MKTLLRDREEAGHLLAGKLGKYREPGAVVLGIPRGGVCVAAVIASDLGLPLEVLPCRKIDHPADTGKSLGSVCTDVVLVHDCARSIPQDYIYHQIGVLRNTMRFECQYYYSGRKAVSLRHRTVIVADDLLSSADSIEACIVQISQQQPRAIVVAVPVVSFEAAMRIRAKADEIVFMRLVPFIATAAEHYAEYGEVDIHVVKALFDATQDSFRKEPSPV